MSKPPVSVPINPQIIVYTFGLAGCWGAAYLYERQRDTADAVKQLEDHGYVDHSTENQIRQQRMSSIIRGKDFRVEESMNDVVWGGKAKQELPPAAKGEGRDIAYERYTNTNARLGAKEVAISIANGEGEHDIAQPNAKAALGATGAVETDARKKQQRRRKRKALPAETEEKEQDVQEQLKTANEKLRQDQQRTQLLVLGVATAAVLSFLFGRK